MYKIEDVVILDTSFPSYKTKLEKSHPHVAKRILNYLNEDDVKNKWVKKATTKIYRFYILSREQIIELPHKPKIKSPLSVKNGIYFNLSELLDANPEKLFVKTVSKTLKPKEA
ncbi:hypothetical protein BLD50_29120 [Bacillus cereus]|nr:hypothetical protein BLD50_29120 [Bacillus cereus]